MSSVLGTNKGSLSESSQAWTGGESVDLCLGMHVMAIDWCSMQDLDFKSVEQKLQTSRSELSVVSSGTGLASLSIEIKHHSIFLYKPH